MAAATPRQEQLTVAAAAAFVLCVGVVSSLPLVGSLSTLVVTLSALTFVYLYVSG